MGLTWSLQEFQQLKDRKTKIVASCIIRGIQADCSYVQERRNKLVIRLNVNGPLDSWSISRSLKEVCHFINALDQVFPIEAGLRGADRHLPNLRWHKLYWLKGKSRCLARLEDALVIFFREILSMPPFISRSRYIIDFLLPWEDRDDKVGFSRRSEGYGSATIETLQSDNSINLEKKLNSARQSLAQVSDKTLSLRGSKQDFYYYDEEDDELYPIED